MYGLKLLEVSSHAGFLITHSAALYTGLRLQGGGRARHRFWRAQRWRRGSRPGGSLRTPDGRPGVRLRRRGAHTAHDRLPPTGGRGRTHCRSRSWYIRTIVVKSRLLLVKRLGVKPSPTSALVQTVVTPHLCSFRVSPVVCIHTTCRLYWCSLRLQVGFQTPSPNRQRTDASPAGGVGPGDRSGSPDGGTPLSYSHYGAASLLSPVRRRPLPAIRRTRSGQLLGTVDTAVSTLSFPFPVLWRGDAGWSSCLAQGCLRRGGSQTLHVSQQSHRSQSFCVAFCFHTSTCHRDLLQAQQWM